MCTSASHVLIKLRNSNCLWTVNILAKLLNLSYYRDGSLVKIQTGLQIYSIFSLAIFLFLTSLQEIRVMMEFQLQRVLWSTRITFMDPPFLGTQGWKSWEILQPSPSFNQLTWLSLSMSTGTNFLKDSPKQVTHHHQKTLSFSIVWIQN